MQEEEKKIKFQFFKAEDLISEKKGETKELPVEESKIEIPETPQETFFEEKSEKISWKEKISLPTNVIYVILGVLAFLIIVSFSVFVWLKTKQKPPQIQKTREEKIISTTTPPLIFATKTQPEISEETVTSTQATTTSEEKTTTTSTIKSEEISFYNKIPHQEIFLNSLDQNEFKSVLLKLPKKKANTIYALRILYNKKIVPYDFIFNFFVSQKSNFSNQIKNELIGKYKILIYNGRIQRHPVLIFEIQNPQIVKEINSKWEKENIIDDFQNLYLSQFKKPTPLEFKLVDYKSYNYHVVVFPDNYKFVWSVAKNYLIYSSAENGVKYALDFINELRGN